MIVTGIFAVLSRVLFGGGEFLRLLQFTSYGFIPGFIGSIITIPVLAPFTGSLRLPALGDPQMIGAMVEQIQHTQTMQMVTLIGIICLLWSGYIWVFGVREAEDLSTRHAAIIVGIPVIIAVAVKVIGVIIIMRRLVVIGLLLCLLIGAGAAAQTIPAGYTLPAGVTIPTTTSGVVQSTTQTQDQSAC